MFIIPGTFWLYACLATMGAIFLALFLPETKGKSLEEVEGLFAQPWCGGSTGQPVMPYDDKNVQYVHIRGLNRDGRESELDSPDDTWPIIASYALYATLTTYVASNLAAYANVCMPTLMCVSTDRKVVTHIPVCVHVGMHTHTHRHTHKPVHYSEDTA